MKSAEDIARMHELYQKGWSKRSIAAHLRISRNTLDRYLRLKPCAPAEPQIQASHSIQAWHIGPYHYTSAGTLSLGGLRIELAPAQQQLLLLFAQKPNQLVSHEEMAQLLWLEIGRAHV